MFSAVLDSCVLWPSLMRDFLLSMAVENIYRPLWSERILEEVSYNEQLRLIRRGASQSEAHDRAEHLMLRMRSSFDDSCVTGWEPLEGTYGLLDPDDEHVVAAAHMSGAGAIVTLDVRDFPMSLLPSGLDIQEPSVFAAHSVNVDPIAASRAVMQIADRSGRRGRPQTPAQILDSLDRLYRFDEATRQVRDLIA